MKKIVLLLLLLLSAAGSAKTQTMQSAQFELPSTLFKIFEYYGEKEEFILISQYTKKSKTVPHAYWTYILTTENTLESEEIKKFLEEVRAAGKRSGYVYKETIRKEEKRVELYEMKKLRYTYNKEVVFNQLMISSIKSKTDPQKQTISVIIIVYQ